jgi:hypothetical protein
MGMISDFGAWLDRKFPDKINAEDVYKSLAVVAQLQGQMTSFEARLDQIGQKLQAFEIGARAFDKEIRELKDELNKVKAVQVMMNRTNKSPVLSTSEPWKR